MNEYVFLLKLHVIIGFLYFGLCFCFPDSPANYKPDKPKERIENNG